MYISKEELEKRLKKTEIQINEKERVKRGKEERLTHEDRVIAGQLAELMPQHEVADLMGISQTTVSNASRGIVGIPTGVDKELKKDVEEAKEEIKKSREDKIEIIKNQLINNLAAAIGHVGNNLHSTDAVEASKVASDMAKILDKVSGRPDSGGGNRTAIIINVPARNEEKNYQVINV